jgi:tetratricopeptide (TPR) repeat protein
MPPRTEWLRSIPGASRETILPRPAVDILVDIRTALRIWAALLFAAACHAQEANEPPQALIVSATGATILRAGSELPLAANPGEILFTGDSLRGGATFLACAGTSQQQTLSPDGDVVFEARQMRVRAGRITDQKPAPGCFLPPLPRSIIASQQHAGAAIARDITRPAPPAPASTDVQGVARLAKVADLERSGKLADAATEMRAVVNEWPDAAWARSRLFVLEMKAGQTRDAQQPPASEPEGQTFAVLIGVSKFQDPEIPPLQFAHQDALDFATLLQSRRAGGVPKDNVIVLTNEAATRSAIQSAIETHLKRRAGKNDTVLLFIASHGATFAVRNRTKGFIVTYDSDPRDLATSGIPMEDIRQLFETELTNVKRLLLYVDVCHAGKLGAIVPRADETNRTAANALKPGEVDVFGMLAAQSNQVAIESINYGGGHGAFTYFLMRALNGDADANGDGKVDMAEFFRYVLDHVSESTENKQIPKQIGDIDQSRVMAVVAEPGIALKDYTGKAIVAGHPAGHTGPPPTDDSAPRAGSRQLRLPGARDLPAEFEAAINEGRILPDADGSAFSLLAQLSGDDRRLAAERLRIALEDRGQQVLLTYLAGDAVPQKRDAFVDGARYFEAAQTLAPDSLYLESRKLFCQGRVAVFDKAYDRAATLLERAVGLDPERAYSYNALGIAYLERAEYDRASLAFRDASRRAPYWPYPVHNLALAQGEKGAYDNAIRAYNDGMKLAPRAAYLPYNLGLLYQRLNRLKDAEAMYKRAQVLDPRNVLVLTALAYLKAQAGKRADAEKLYREALSYDSASLAANHDLALLLAADPKRFDEAVALWRANLNRSPEHLPSRLSLARALARAGRRDDAIVEYEKVVAARPEYVAARLALARLYSAPGAQLPQIEAALKLEPENPEALELAGDVYRAAGRAAEARAAYEHALRVTTDRSARKRLRDALRKIQ